MAMTDLQPPPQVLPAARLLSDRVAGTGRPQRRRDVAVEVGKTMLILTFIGVGIVALRYALVAAYGLLH
jgi:hypothetical protein